MPLHLARVARNVSDTLRERFGRAFRAGRRGSLVCERQQHEPWRLILLFPPSRPVFPFPVHWPELGVDLGLDYCHPLLIYHWSELGVDLGLDHWHQPHVMY